MDQSKVKNAIDEFKKYFLKRHAEAASGGYQRVINHTEEFNKILTLASNACDTEEEVELLFMLTSLADVLAREEMVSDIVRMKRDSSSGIGNISIN